MSVQGKVLVLGAGLVTKPLVHYLSKHNFHVIVANRTLQHAEELIKGAAHAEARRADVTKDEDLHLIDSWTAEVDAVVSMLPYLYHATCAKFAIKHKKHFFTTSYVSDAMKALEPEAKNAGIVLLNECGVDPGSDHMSAMRVIDGVKAKGGDVVDFSSFCGGLPAPDSNDNPFGYKFSWAPRGVLLAGKNDARFLKDGKEVYIPGKDLFDNYQVSSFEGLGEFESYPNRNSNQYLEIYNLPNARGMIRGTYRYKGWCPTIKKFADVNYLDLETRDFTGKTYKQILAEMINKPDSADLQADVAAYLHLEREHDILKHFAWLGLFEDIPVPSDVTTRLDALCAAMLKRMVYKEGEKDMILMQHKFTAEYPATKKREFITSTLITFGEPNGDTAMSRTVSFPVAIAIRLVLEKKVKLSPGIYIPTTPELYHPILDELETLGIKFEDKVVKVEDM